MSDEMQKLDSENSERKFAPYKEPYSEVRDPSDIDDISTLEQLAETAKAQATDAAEAFRQGRIMEDAEADLSASGDDRLIALLCYWSQLVMPFVMPLIVLLSESGKRRPFQRHHAIQSLGLTGAIIGLAMAVTVGIGLLQILPVIGLLIGLIALCFSPIAYFMVVIAYVFYGWQAHKGKRFSIPILSRFLRNQGWMN